MTAFLRDEHGQDLTEYALLLAFVVVASAALFLQAADSMAGIWSVNNNNLTAANHLAQS